MSTRQAADIPPEVIWSELLVICPFDSLHFSAKLPVRSVGSFVLEGMLVSAVAVAAPVAASTHRMSIQREERIQRERELQRRQQEARRLAQKREKRQQQLQQQKQRRTAAAADFKAQDTECNKLPPEERTTVRNNGDLQLQEQKQTQEQNKRQH